MIQPMAYSKELFEEKQSNNQIHRNRLKQLDNLTHDVLKETSQASYQENIIEVCVEDAISQFME